VIFFPPKRSALLLLFGVLAMIILAQVLPQVHLPETAFPRNTSLVAVQAQVTSTPVAASAITLFSFAAKIDVGLGGENRKASNHSGTRELSQISNHPLRC
jgi:hypothetical protein